MDLLFTKINVVTMDDSNLIMTGAYVGISNGTITYLSMTPPSEMEIQNTRMIDGTGKVLMPGLINAHTHIPMTAIRGYADDYKLQDWLYNYIFPIEGKLTSGCVYYGAKLGMLECLSNGVTAIADMYFDEPIVAQAACECGIRANVSNAVLYFSDSFDPNTDRSALELTELLKTYKNHPLIKPDAAVHAAYTSKSDGWKWAAQMAQKHDLGIQVHISETKAEMDECMKMYNATPTEVLCDAGVFDFNVNAAHCVWLTDSDMDIFARYGATATHCPVSNLKLASGTARIAQMLSKNVNVALGTDGVASNNNHDLFEEIKLTSLLHKMINDDASVMPALTALKMATVNGAKALNRPNLGKIKIGYDADVIMLDFDRPHLMPCYDIISNIVYSAKGSDVVMTVVCGKIVYENGEFLGGDFRQTYAHLKEHMSDILTGFNRKIIF